MVIRKVSVPTFMDIKPNAIQQDELRSKYLPIVMTPRLTGSLYKTGDAWRNNLSNLDIAENLPLTVIFADLNGLKMTNDMFGHRAGDELIRKAAQILMQSSRREDVVARIGGDEFIILLPKTNQTQGAEIMSMIGDGFADAKVEAMRCSISLGSATKRSVFEKLEEVFTNAENEMYKNKTKNRKSINKDIINTFKLSLLGLSVMV